MSTWHDTVRRLTPPVWAGVLLCIAFLATPAPFATLASADAGRVVGHMFAREAPLSLLLAVVVLMLERRRTLAQPDGDVASPFTAPVMLSLLTLACTVVGYYALQPLMAQARLGQGALSFGQLHAISLGLFGVKMLAVCWLAVLAVRPSGTSR
jgi:hypothetical protein